MPSRITPSKEPVPVDKRSSLRNKSYEVEPASGRKIYPSRGYIQPIRLPPISDAEAASFQTSRSVQRYNPAQSPPEIAPGHLLMGNEHLLLSDPSQSPPEIAHDQSASGQLPWQLTTSRRSVRASRDNVVAPLSIDVCNDVMINPPPASAVCTSILIDATSIPVSTVTSSVSAVDTKSSVELPTSVVDSTSALSTPSSDVNPTSVGKSRTMVNNCDGSDSKRDSPPEISGTTSKRDCAGSYLKTERDTWFDDCNAATSSSVRGGGRIGATKSRDGYTLRPDAGSTS